MNNRTSMCRMTLSERAQSANRALQLFQMLRDETRQHPGSSGCVAVLSELGYELIPESEEGALGRLSGLLRAGGTPVALLRCSAKGEVSTELLDHDPSLDERVMAQMQETFQGMHYARLLYPNLSAIAPN